MNNIEIDELIKEDIQKIPDIEFNSNEVLNKCKTNNIRFKNKVFKFSVLISCIILAIIVSLSIIILNGSSNHNRLIDETGKIKIITEKSDVLDDMLDNPDAYRVSWYGISVYIFCDYSKHPKYNEWIEKYGLKGVYDGEESVSNQKYNDRSAEYDNKNYFYLLNSECYELIKDGFPTSNTFLPDGLAEWIVLNYSTRWIDKEFDPNETMEQAMKNMDSIKESFYQSRDYSNLFELAKEDYVTHIDIVEYEPRYNGDE